jgi:hypothetical protein
MWVQTLALVFAIAAAAAYAAERIGDDAIINSLETRATNAEQQLKKFTPRDLSSSQQAAVVAAIERFKGQKYTGSMPQGLDDGCSFWKVLYDVLDAAKWTYVPAPSIFHSCEPPVGISIASEPGVRILVHEEKANEVGNAAESLAAALAKQGIKAIAAASPYATTNPDEQASLAIVVGVRPPPP